MMASVAGRGFEYERRGKRPREQEDEEFQGVTSEVMTPDTLDGSDHWRRKKRPREHEGREIVGKGANSDYVKVSV